MDHCFNIPKTMALLSQDSTGLQYRQFKWQVTEQSLLTLVLSPLVSLPFTFCFLSFLPLIYIALYPSTSPSRSLVPSLAATKRLKRDYFWHVNVMCLLGIVQFFLSHAVLSQYDAHTDGSALRVRVCSDEVKNVSRDINHLQLQKELLTCKNHRTVSVASLK